jgi:hypothetical protein
MRVVEIAREVKLMKCEERGAICLRPDERGARKSQEAGGHFPSLGWWLALLASAHLQHM